MHHVRTLLGLCVVSAALAAFGSGCGFKAHKAGNGASDHAGGAGGGSSGKAGVVKSDFGKTKEGEAVDLYTLTNKHGVVAKITNFGGIVTEIHVPDKNGKMDDVVLGFKNLDGYLAGHPFFGAIAGRYANRIAKGKFTLDGKEYTLATNNGPNHLHGGNKGFDKQVWTASQAGDNSVKLTYLSKDGEEGYPGNLT